MGKLLILDKDGTLVRPKSGGAFVQHPEDQELLPGVAEAIARYHVDGWRMAIASNQGGVAAGHKSLQDAIAEMAYCLILLPEFVRTAVFCPDDGMSIEFVRKFDGVAKYRGYLRHKYMNYARSWRTFRKPDPGMIHAVIDFCTNDGSGDSVEILFVGDRPEDQQAATNAGVNFMWASDWLYSTAD